MGAMWGVPPSGASRGRRAGVWCVALLAGLALPVGAADPHGGHAEPKPSAKPAAKPEHKPAEPAAPHKVEGKADSAAEAASLEALRQRLQGKLADGHGSTPVAKVTNSAGHGSTARKPAAKKLAAVDPHAATHAAAAAAGQTGRRPRQHASGQGDELSRPWQHGAQAATEEAGRSGSAYRSSCGGRTGRGTGRTWRAWGALVLQR